MPGRRRQPPNKRTAVVFTGTRLVLAALGLLLFVSGLLLIAAGGADAASGVVPLVIGAVLLVVVAMERNRYRSEAAERGSEPSGPGGGERSPLPPRFQRTDERFIDPTTGRTMRVWLDRRSGERRYQAEDARA